MEIAQSTCNRAAKQRDCRFPRKPRERGFTIVEVTVAAAVMVLVIAGSLTVMQRAFMSLDTARNLTIAGQIMQGEFEKMRLRDWSKISAYAAKETIPIDAAFTSNSFIGNRFTLVRSATTISTTTGAGMRQIVLTVSWKSLSGYTLSRSYTSYYGENGLYDYFYNAL